MKKFRDNIKYQQMRKFVVIIFLTFPILNFSQTIYDLNTAKEKAKKESSEKKSPSFIIEIGQNTSDWIAKNYTDKQKDSLFLATSNEWKKALNEFGFPNSTLLFAENDKNKKNYRTVYINGSFYGSFIQDSSIGWRKICELFYNNPFGTTISNRKYHLSENYFEEYTEIHKSKEAKYTVPDSFYYFYYLFRNISDDGSLVVIYYDKDKSDYNTVMNSYKNAIKSHQSKKNNIGLILIDTKAFPKSFKGVATNDALVKSDRFKEDFYLQLWYDNQVLFDFYGHNSSKVTEMKKILAILGNVNPIEIDRYANSSLELAKYKDFYKVIDKKTLLEYMDSDIADIKFHQTFNENFTSALKIKAELSRNLGDLKLHLKKNNGLAKKTLGLELYDVKIIKGK